ncbi:hypothetical protein quinque_011615 [Culex quinquefasciatus]
MISTSEAVFSTDYGDGRLIEWICNTLRHLNGTCDPYQVKCEGTDLEQCYNVARWYNASRLYDVTLDTLVYTEYLSNFLYSTIPDKLQVAAPRGRRLTAYELFAIPFRRELWIALTISIVLSYLLTWIRPNLFQNDLVLMSICGFERHDLNQVSRLEKITMISLIIVTFVLLSAYEAKLVAFMSSFPYAASPRSFGDLLRSGITIPVHERDSFGVGNDTRFAQVFKYSSATSVTYDSTQRNVGLLGTSQALRMAIKYTVNYDAYLQRSKFVILDRFTVGLLVPAYFVGRRNFLKGRYHQSEMAFMEAGLMDFWTRRNARRFFGTEFADHIETANGEAEGNVLGLKELGPVCFGLIGGCSLSFAVFLFELCYFRSKCCVCEKC